MYTSVSVRILWYLIMIPFYQNAYTYIHNSYRNGVSEHVKRYGMRAIKLSKVLHYLYFEFLFEKSNHLKNEISFQFMIF